MKTEQKPPLLERFKQLKPFPEFPNFLTYIGQNVKVYNGGTETMLEIFQVETL